MSNATGQVQTVQRKTEVNGKVFRSPLVSLKINNQWFNCGFDDPKVSEGDVVTVEYTEGKYGKDVTKGSVKMATAEATKVAVKQSDDRQTSIVYQSQHRDAVEAINFSIQNGYISMPTKKADQYSVYLDLIKDLTVQWCKEALNPDLSTAETSDVEEEQFS